MLVPAILLLESVNVTKLIVDTVMQAKLSNLNGVLEVCDEAGQTLGYFHPLPKQDSGAGDKIRSPFSEEELERRRQQRTGRSLRKILEGLK
jgi:hypothetical protein